MGFQSWVIKWPSGIVWDIPCIARVMVWISFSGGGSNVSQRSGWNNFSPRVALLRPFFDNKFI